MKPLDKALEEVDKIMLEQAAQQQKMNPILDRKLKELYRLDDSIKYFEGRIKIIEKEKKQKLDEMQNLLDLAMKSSHSLKNGYTVKPKSNRKMKIEDPEKFLRWIKKHKTPNEVMEFLSSALKLTNVKKFCEKEFDNQKEQGEIYPSVDGIRYGKETFTQLQTCKEIKK